MKLYKGRAICTKSGHWAGPDAGAPSLEDAASAMGKLCRYAGHCEGFYSVLIHSLIVDDLTDGEAKLYSLIHDVTESIINDIPKPFKIPAMAELEARMYSRILRDWDIPYPEKHVLIKVHAADYEALLGEVWTNGPPSLKKLAEFKRRSKRAEKLVRYYQRKYPFNDAVRTNSKAVKEFVSRFKKYKSQLEEN